MGTDIKSVDISENLRHISITGRLDIQGSESIDVKFASLAVANGRRVVVDLSAVSLLASIGIRALISNAKALQQRGGKMVLFVGNNAIVIKTLQSSGIEPLIPMFENIEAAFKDALI
jgi:anti-anti-sigma factor